MKNSHFLILLAFVVANLSGCASYYNDKSATEKRIDIIIADTYNKYQNKEIVFERMTMDFPEYHEEVVTLAEKSKKEMARLKDDGTELNTFYDGYGNKTETRMFFHDKLIKFVVIKTTPGGVRQGIVYAQNGEVKLLPQDLTAEALELSGDEIARSVEVFEGRQENETLANLQHPATVMPVQIKPNQELTAPPTNEKVEQKAMDEKLISKNVEKPVKDENQGIIPEEK
jgi:hypothetical protein